MALKRVVWVLLKRTILILSGHYIMFSLQTMPENIHTPLTEESGLSWGAGGSVRPKNFKQCVKLYWNYQRGGGVGS